ncbi:histidine phosphatase family protein [Peribacillus frigoritolerans]|uniref:histidine phosphatase family protein n=1 Tax=Peribacillus frigoritolerans TaxID=450367 RepID=UPI000FDC4431|nr:histidine phosphatase family protein [Peribacillus frigoritolerans]AZV61996.1 histidine phosphatase family protein [Peribacillus frigoritolerans]
MADIVAITLLRHGLTVANERKAYLGWTDSPLSTEGEKEILDLRGSYPQYEKIFSSDLSRCVETARLLFPHAVPIKNPLFREMNFGSWEGRTNHELKTDGDYLNWLERPMEALVPGGESYPAFSERVNNGWKQLIACKENRFALMTHGGVIRDLLVRYAPKEKSFFDWGISHGRGYELIWEDRNSLRRGERCTLLQEAPIMGKQNG